MKKLFYPLIAISMLLVACSNDSEVTPISKAPEQRSTLTVEDESQTPPRYRIYMCTLPSGGFGFQCYNSGTYCTKYTPNCTSFGSKVTGENTELNSSFIEDNYQLFYDMYKKGIFVHPAQILEDLKYTE